MSKVEVIAIEPCNQHRPGTRFEVGLVEAKEMEAKGLVKMRGPQSNKMRTAPLDKQNPSKAVGAEKPASASPAVRASTPQTARSSASGAKKPPGDVF